MSRFPRHGLPGSGLPWWRRLRLLDVVLLSAVPVLGAAYLLWTAVGTYQRAVQFDDLYSRAVSVEGAFRDEARQLLHAPARIAADHRLDADSPDPAVINLLLPQDRWRTMLDSPWVGWDWEEGVLEWNGIQEPVDLRKRGDNSIHWLTPKLSLTVRTSREELFKGYRTLGLSTKDVLTQYVTNRLPRDFGVLAARTAIAPVFVNRRFYGLFRTIEPVDESMLRSARRMPGNIYRGDAAERGEYYKALPRSLFRNVSIWERVAMNDRPSGPPPDAIRRFLEDLNGSTFAAHQRAMAWVDRDAVVRELAIMLLVGDPYHDDDVHNQYWYEDPGTGLLTPIPWDLRLLPLDHPGQPVNEFWRSAFRDPFLVDAALRRVGGLLHDQNALGHADSLLQDATERFAPYLAFERLREGVIPPLGEPAEIRAILRANAGVLDAWMGDARFGLAWGAGGPGGTGVLDLVSRGMAGADLLGLDFPASGRSPGGIVMDRNQDGVLDPTDPVVPGAWAREGDRWRFAPQAPLALLPGWSTPKRGIAPGQVHYRFFVRSMSGARPGVELRNRLTGAPARIDTLATGEPLVSTGSFSPWSYPVRRGATQVWTGVRHLTATTRIGSADTLRIAPGATLLMDPDVSLISEGLVLAQGTADRPIRIVRSDPARPWGALALQGAGASGSRFTHVEFAGGGGALVGRIEYTGSVNVHGAVDVTFTGCRFLDNVRSDDMIHVLDGAATIGGGQVLRANSDAIDFDNSGGWIVDNVIRGSGGDGIDLMASTPVIAGNLVEGSGDKAISVGEASRPAIIGNRLRAGFRGVEIKDGSEPLLIGNRVEDNATGFRLDRKNWRYGRGGWGRIVQTIGEGNQVGLDLDSLSRLSLPAGGTDPELARLLAAQAGVRWIPGADWVGRWEAIAAPTPVLETTFNDGFDPLPAWTMGGGGERLIRRGGSLELGLRRTRGVMERMVAWTVPAGARGYLIAEVGSQDLSAIEVTAHTVSDSVGRAVPPLSDSRMFQFVVLRLPPGTYTRVSLAGTPHPRIERLQRSAGFWDEKRGQLQLHRLMLVVEPAAPGR